MANDTRRRFLVTTGVAASGFAGLAGCLGGSDDGNGNPSSIADAEPLGSPVDSSAVSWDDLGDLEGEVTIYSGRTREQIDPVFVELDERYENLDLNLFHDDNDVYVNQILQEGDATPADLMYSQDPGALGELERNDALQALPQDVVDAVPESYRDPDGYWTGVTGRVRSIIYHTERWADLGYDADDLPTNIFEYATDERFQDIISTRPNSGTFRGFIQAMVELEGEEATREWVRGMVTDQNVQLFSGGSNQAAAIDLGGDGDPIVGLGNSYYAARILDEDPDAPIDVAFTENDPGCLFSVAGVGVMNEVDDPELVAEFVRHLLAAEGQEFMMDANGEYPVVEGIDYVGDLPNLEDINPPSFDLSSFDMDLREAQDLLNEEGMTV
ncbi:extracellular solute-binding protein [Natronosalvus vescus]|uniref:extracellular solute-binding protein n=1 Tax=Natronosalvus vescus TaxID=2953881 RepID=UPI0020912F5D|nr:extracellular solute-binding protein [Natronosalvus vescus]